MKGQLKRCHVEQLRRSGLTSAPTESSDSPIDMEEIDLPSVPEVEEVPPLDRNRSPSPVVRTYPQRQNRGQPPTRYEPGTS